MSGPRTDTALRAPAAFLRQAVTSSRLLPFVYCYPPRTSYVAEEVPDDLRAVWARDAQHGSDLNLYIHIPFCRYRCAFCGLYTVTTQDRDADLHARYVASLKRDLHYLAPTLSGRRVRTVFLGGGTPLAIGVPLLVDLLNSLSDVFPDVRETAEEISIEASPDAVLSAAGALNQLVTAGVNRVSVGLQSLDPAELKRAGRGHLSPDDMLDSLARLRAAGVSNIGADLIVGLEGQTDQSLAQSLEALLEFQPETVSLYLINPRGGTGYRQRMAIADSGADLYPRLAASAATLLAAGYVRETSVQFKRPARGGLLHKRLYFEGQSVLGLGSGARSYTAELSYLTGGGFERTPSEIEAYLTDTAEGPKAQTGVILTSEETTRRRIVLGLQQLARDAIPRTHGGDLCEPYASVLSTCIELGLMTTDGFNYSLTECGYVCRDLICWSLFSDQALHRHAELGLGFGEAQRSISAA